MRLPQMLRHATSLLAAAAAVAAAPAAQAQSQPQSVIRYSASAEPRVLDSMVNWLSVTHQHSYLVYDNLYSLDDKFQPRPQMVETATKSADGLVTTFTLREGLQFHDGAPVTAADAVASIARWSKRDNIGRKLVELGMKLDVLDARRFTVTLSVDTPLLTEGFAKPTATGLFVLREKDAQTDPMTAVKEIVGSGPFRFVPAEYAPGAKLVYARNPTYRPRAEAPSFLAGGKVAKVDRVEWIIMPDSSTAIAALQTGELDIYETPPLDLLPLLQANPNITVAVHGTQGQIGFLRPNFKLPPFDKPQARRALAILMEQPDFMAVTAGADGKYWKTCYSFLACGGANETQTQMDWMARPQIAEAKRLFQEAGYDGRPIVIIAPGDNEIIKGFGTIAAEKLKAAGLNVDIQYMDFATLMSRRNKQDPTSQGGWNIFPMWSYGFEFDNPMGNVALSAACTNAAYPGWTCDDTIEKLKDGWARESDPAKRRAIVGQLQARAAEVVPVVPLGQFFAPVAYRRNITGMMPTPIPVFWNIEKR